MILSARRGRTPICLFALLFAVVVPVSPAGAATFAVSKVADTNDGVCNADCSLREAIVAANAAAGGDTITFAVAGLFTISGSALPQITGSLVVNGTSAPGWVSAPVVRIDGTGLASGSGLSLAAGASSSSLSALAVTGFPGYGIEIAERHDGRHPLLSRRGARRHDRRRQRPVRHSRRRRQLRDRQRQRRQRHLGQRRARHPGAGRRQQR